jgi:hypothetical protein
MDWVMLQEESKKIRLIVNVSKCELITDDVEVVAKFQAIAPDIKHVSTAGGNAPGSCSQQRSLSRKC